MAEDVGVLVALVLECIDETLRVADMPEGDAKRAAAREIQEHSREVQVRVQRARAEMRKDMSLLNALDTVDVLDCLDFDPRTATWEFWDGDTFRAARDVREAVEGAMEAVAEAADKPQVPGEPGDA